MLTGNHANRSLGDVATELERAFSSAGYVERSYYAVPQGFALASRLEQINSDGSPAPGAIRWSANIAAPKVFSLASYLRALLGATPGDYRVVIFVVTAAPVTQTTNEPSLQQAQEWLSGGANKLPASIGNIPFTSDSACTALIYEFLQESRDSSAVLKLPSPLTGLAHLEAAGLWRALQQ